MPVVAPVKSNKGRDAIARASACAFSTSASLVSGDASPADPITPTLIFIKLFVSEANYPGFRFIPAFSLPFPVGQRRLLNPALAASQPRYFRPVRVCPDPTNVVWQTKPGRAARTMRQYQSRRAGAIARSDLAIRR